MSKMTKYLALLFIILGSTPLIFLQSIKADTAGPIEVKSITIEENVFHQIQLDDKWDNKEYECLLKNIYFEAGVESNAGKIAVGMVTLNRVMSDKYPDTICEVVTQGPISKWWLEEHGKEVPIRHKCQFSWYCDGKSDVPYYGESWYASEDIAYQLYENYINEEITLDITEGSMYYHADYVNPGWAKRMHKVVKIGSHIFYR